MKYLTAKKSNMKQFTLSASLFHYSIPPKPSLTRPQLLPQPKDPPQGRKEGRGGLGSESSLPMPEPSLRPLSLHQPRPWLQRPPGQPSPTLRPRPAPPGRSRSSATSVSTRRQPSCGARRRRPPRRQSPTPARSVCAPGSRRPCP